MPKPWLEVYTSALKCEDEEAAMQLVRDGALPCSLLVSTSALLCSDGFSLEDGASLQNRNEEA